MAPPLFGLRWVPEAQLRPLRYLPSPPREPPDQPSPSLDPSHKLHHSVRSLTVRLADAEESVRQKSEQIRWLKEMTKDDSRRARVSRWMSGPLLRVFSAWKRVVRRSVRESLNALELQLNEGNSRHRELQAQCDELMRDSGVLTAALERFYRLAHTERLHANRQLLFRRWASKRQRLRTRGPTAAEAFSTLRSATARSRHLRHLNARGHQRTQRRLMSRWLRALHAHSTQQLPLRRGVELQRLLAVRWTMRWLRGYARRSAAISRASSLMILPSRRG